ncbi:unnamed protein product, partial [marine sediment metagenome]
VPYVFDQYVSHSKLTPLKSKFALLTLDIR